MTDLPPPLDIDQLTSNLSGACSDGDAIRLATLIRDNTTPESGTFTRPELIGLWSARWPHHASNPAQSRRPQYRIQRALPRLTTSLVLGPAGDGTDSYKITHAQGMELVASRIGAANAQDASNPNNTSIGFIQDVWDAAALMAGIILGASVAEMDSSGTLAADGDTTPGGMPGDLQMHVEADVVKAGQQ